LQDNRSVNFLTSPDFTSFLGTIMQVLAPWPEARRALVDALGEEPPARGPGAPRLPQP
jgi:hypothetical protein